MNENFYQSTRQTILQKHKERVEQADSDRDEELTALEKLRPYWESLPIAQNGNNQGVEVKKPVEQTADLKKSGRRSDFPQVVRQVVESYFLATDTITQPLVYDKLLQHFPEELKGIDEANIRSRISKTLKRMTRRGILALTGKSDSLGNALIYSRKASDGSISQLNFDSLDSDDTDLNEIDFSEVNETEGEEDI